MSRRVLKGCIATLAPEAIAKRFATASDLGELQAAAQEHNGQLLEGLRTMCALVLQPARDVEVGSRLGGGWAGGATGEGASEWSVCWHTLGLICCHNCTSRSSRLYTHPLACTHPTPQDARSKLQQLYRQLRALDLETQAGLTGGWRGCAGWWRAGQAVHVAVSGKDRSQWLGSVTVARGGPAVHLRVAT